MSFHLLMAMSALHSRNHFVQRELIPMRGIAGVASKTSQLVTMTHQSPCRFMQVGGKHAGTPQRRPKAMQLLKPAHAALVELAVFLQYVGLANGRAGAHRPANRHNNGGYAICNGIKTLISFAFDFVKISTIICAKKRMIDQDFASLHSLQSMRHIGSALR